MSADVADVVDLASARQPVLRIASENINADLLSDWIPLLGAVAPSGALSLSGTIAPGEPESAVQVRLSGSDLGIRIGRERAELGGAAVDFDLHPEGHFTAGLSIEGVTSEDLFASRLTAAFEGGGEEPVRLRIDGARGGRADARIDRVAIECALTGDRAEVRRLEVAGLGGTLLAQGELARDEGDVLAVRFAPQWDGVDFAGFLRLFGVDLDIQGLFTGQAALAARRSAEETFLETLSGVFDVRLTEGSVQDLNLARTTVANLGAIPGVRQAIERRAEEKIPELLARTSRIEALQVAGSVADGAVSVDRLELDAPDYSLDAKGRVALDGGVDLDGHLVLGERATEALASASVVLAMLARGGEPIRIPIRVAGTYPDLVSAPSPAFVTESIAGSAAGAAGGGAGGFLRNLLGGGREAGRSAGDGRE